MKPIIFSFLLLSLLACQNNSETAKKDGKDSTQYKLKTITEEIISPIGIVNAKDGSNRLFILEQPGRIRIIRNGKLQKTPFLDIKTKIVKLNNTYTEKGLLGLAFHPDFKNNGRFFVYYSAPSQNKNSDHQSVISEFKVSPSGSDKASPEEKIILTFEQPESNHNGGCLAFGKDGYLYISTGDGGGAGDEHGTKGNAQDLTNLLGKILRIDVDKGSTYTIPADNPFTKNGQMKEIYAYGLRNPWRFSFDPRTGKLFAGDVGQNKYEEVDIIEKGKNYGWRKMEGLHEFDPKLQLASKPVDPIHEYSHDYGISITGGHVYRGKELSDLNGVYIFGDWKGKVRYIEGNNGGVWTAHELFNLPGTWINSFGTDEHGEIYIAAQKNVGAVSPTGVIYKIVK